MGARREVEVHKRGCFVSMVMVAAVLLLSGWYLTEFALHPGHCSRPACERWSRQLDLSAVISSVGFGCLVIAALNIRTGLSLSLGVVILGLTALAGIANPNLVAISGVDFLALVSVIVWYVAGWLD